MMLPHHDCPDCQSETHLIHLGDNIHVAQILHDDTCPTYAQIKRHQTQKEPR